MKLGIASDHGGFELKTAIIQQLSRFEFVDLGASNAERVDYPLFADKLCQAIRQGVVSEGVLICGTGIGISIRANRYPGIRAALVYDEFTAKMAREHNNANILCLGGRTTTVNLAVSLIQTWQTVAFEGGRHTHRLSLLDAPIVWPAD